MRAHSLALLLLILGSLYQIAPARAQGDPARSFDAVTAAVRAPGTKIRIDLIGDSTQTNHAGYGRGFCANLTAEVDCVNMAEGGASTRTFREQGLWKRSLETKPDYMLIQFGHNDMQRKVYYPPATTMAQYEANLRRFVSEARAAGTKPILVTPITRQYFGSNGKIHPPLAAHAATMRRVAREMHVPLIDLHNESVDYLDGLGPTRAYALAITAKDDSGKTVVDKTHWNWKGSYVFGRMVAVDMAKVVPELARYVRPMPAPLPPEGIKEMGIFHGAPVRIVLAGDSTLNNDMGWGKGFCAVLTPNVTCIDDTVASQSPLDYFEHGSWSKALHDKGDYYLIQFGPGDQGSGAPAKKDAEQERYGAYLQRSIREVRAIGAVPVLVTPVGWLDNERNSLGSAPALKKDAVTTVQIGAEEDDVTVIDLYKMSATIQNKHMTLLQQQQALGYLAADTLIKTRVELGPDVIGEPKTSRVVSAAKRSKP